MCRHVKDLNIPISEAKLTPLTTRIVCLDIEIDSVTACMSIPPGKLEEILQTCQSFRKLSYFSRRQLQSVIGSLMFKPARYFINRLLDTLRNMNGTKTRMTESVKKHINCFLLFVKHFNGTTTYMHRNLYCSDVIDPDACLTGFGWQIQSTSVYIPVQGQYYPLHVYHCSHGNVKCAIST